jgi:YfiH family protein
MPGNGFALRNFQGMLYYSCLAFDSLPRLRHGFSTRVSGRIGGRIGDGSLNLSETSWDLSARVRENRRLFLSALNLEEANLITLRQIHSNRAYIIRDISSGWNRLAGDALISGMENAALAVQVADCIPILIADPVHYAVAAVHSGWRGTLGEILPRTIRAMQQDFDSDPKRLLIALGPGIRSCCFEVGLEVARPFELQYPGHSLTKSVIGSPQKRFLDLFKILDIQMTLMGVPIQNRFDLAACTGCNTNQFFSYRVEGPASGRMMAVIGMLPG